ncbi:unnamed protein product [Brachionus calyciflorus]|uniref:Uncharacterized protein n=1 Tax=Brachionus calyciflorus TaxID=104777 RepID=A0A814AFH3_9BILA|nr:unnamed protein product [Brachionus calyciflorus]
MESADAKPKCMKSKLDLIWNELQTNLPSIDLGDTEENSDFEDYEFNNNNNNEDDDLLIRDFNNQINDDDYLSDEFLNGFDKATVSDVYLNETENLNQKLENFNKIKTSNLKLISASTESAKTAAKITQNIFDNTNSKLNMDIFNSINIDEMLNSVDKNSDHKKNFNKINLPSHTTTSHIVDDQNLIKKLAEFSTKFSKDENLNNLNLQTGAASSVENELKSLDKLDDLITNDLKSFLKSHKIKDGNLTETRRIDLRDTQNMVSNTRVRVYSKPKAEHLFAEILKEDNVYPDYKNGQTIKFMNDDGVSSSSESESDDEDEDRNTLWFERYRQHRLLKSVNKN